MLEVLPTSTGTIGVERRTEPVFMTPKTQQDAVADYGHRHSHHQHDEPEDLFASCFHRQQDFGFSLGAWGNTNNTNQQQEEEGDQITPPLPQHNQRKCSWDDDENNKDHENENHNDDDDWSENGDSVNETHEHELDIDIPISNLQISNENAEEPPGKRTVSFSDDLVTKVIEYPKPSPEDSHLLHYCCQELMEFRLDYEREKRSMSLLERLDCDC